MVRIQIQRGHSWSRLVVLVAFVSLLAPSCMATPAATPSAEPTATATPSPLATASPAPTYSMTPDPTETPHPTITPPATTTPDPTATPTATAGLPGTGITINWRRHRNDLPTGGASVSVFDSAVVDNRIVIIGEVDYQPAIWWEDEDLVWRRAAVPTSGEEAKLLDIVSLGTRLVVVGNQDWGERAIVWLSDDGTSWEAVESSGLDGLVYMARLAVGADGLIMFGRDGEADGQPVAAVSADGRRWRRASTPTTVEVAGSDAIAGGGELLTAFHRRIDEDHDCTGGDCRVGPVRVWRASGTDSWRLLGELPASQRAWAHTAAVGPAGWIAIGHGQGTPLAWTSADGISWRLAQNAPTCVGAVFADRAGFIAVGAYDAAGEWDAPDLHTVTWTSSDGRIWREAGDLGDGGQIASLRRRGRTLIGIGTVNDGDGPYTGAVWTARLPDASRDDGPAPVLEPKGWC